jgi:hypothetical protein
MRLDNANRAALLTQLKLLREQLVALDEDMASDEQLFTDTIDGETSALELLRTVIRQAIDAEVFAEALKARRDELDQRAGRFKERASRCRAFAGEAMQTLGITSIAAEDFGVTLRPGRAAVRIVDEALLPKAFVRTRSEPMKQEIGDALRAGQRVAGAELSNAAPVLTVRRA